MVSNEYTSPHSISRSMNAGTCKSFPTGHHGALFLIFRLQYCFSLLCSSRGCHRADIKLFRSCAVSFSVNLACDCEILIRACCFCSLTCALICHSGLIFFCKIRCRTASISKRMPLLTGRVSLLII